MRALLLSVLVVAVPALAHIKLDAPANFQVVDLFGSPNKSAPCGGAGTATNAVTTVTAGSMLTVTWSEPILHPGHFRIGIATDPAQFVTPTPVLSASGTNCQSAPIELTPVAPTLVDGLLAHTAASATGGWTTQVQVPMISCENCTLQLMQFMSSHAPPCFYFQCAKLRIVMPADGGVPEDAGTTGGLDAGVTDAGVGGTVDGPAAGCGCSGSGSVVAMLGLGLLGARRRRAGFPSPRPSPPRGRGRQG